MPEVYNGLKDPFIFILFWINTTSYLWFPPLWEVSQCQYFQTWIEILIFPEIYLAEDSGFKLEIPLV